MKCSLFAVFLLTICVILVEPAPRQMGVTGCWSAGNHANQIGPSVTIPESAVAVQLQSVHSTARKNSVTFINLGFHSQLESAL